MARSASQTAPAPSPEAHKPDWAETTEQQVLDAALRIVPDEELRTSQLAPMASKRPADSRRVRRNSCCRTARPTSPPCSRGGTTRRR